MSFSKITRNKISELFQKFKQIPDKHHYDYIAFCNYHFNDIQKLEFEEYIEIKFAYIKALYSIDRAALFYKIADQALIELINQIEFTEQYKSIYRQIIVLKAQRLLEEKKFNQAKELYLNIYHLNPQDVKTRRRLWSIAFRQIQSQQMLWLSSSAVFLISTLLSVIGVHFIIIPFFSEYVDLSWKIVIGLLLLSVTLVSISFIRTYILTSTFIQKKKISEKR